MRFAKQKLTQEQLKLIRAINDDFLDQNYELVEQFKEINGYYPGRYAARRDARLQAAAEKFHKEIIGKDNPIMSQNDDRYVFDHDTVDGQLNDIETAVARAAATTPVTIENGRIYGGQLNNLGATSEYYDINESFGAPVQNLSHLTIDLNNPVHVGITTGIIDPSLPNEVVKEIATVRKAMKENDEVLYGNALKRRDVPEQYAYDFMNNYKREKVSSAAGPRKTVKVMDYIKGSGNSGRGHIHLNAEGLPIVVLKQDQSPEGKAKMSQMLEARGGSLSKQLVDTGFRSSIDPTSGMEIPGQTLEMDHAQPQSVIGPELADHPSNRTWLEREANGQTKNDRDLAETMILLEAGAKLKALGIQPVDATKDKGNELYKKLYVNSAQTHDFGRTMPPKMAAKNNALYAPESEAFVRALIG